MTPRNTDLDSEIRDRLHLETAVIRWHELQTYFAAGSVYWVSPALNLLDVGVALTTDNGAVVKPWVDASQLMAATDEQAAEWFAKDATMWGLVVQPFVLVQERDATQLSS